MSIRIRSAAVTGTEVAATVLMSMGSVAVLVLAAGAGCSGGGTTPGDAVVEIEEIERLPVESPVAPAPAEQAAEPKPVTAASSATPSPPDTAPTAAPTTVAQTAASATPSPVVSEKVRLGDASLTAGIPGTGKVTLADVEAWLAEPRNHVVLQPVLPLGLSQGKDQIRGLDTNPLTRAKVELGRQLYFDTRLSADSTVSCASCHDPDTGYTAHTPTGVGIRGQKGGRNSPVSFNRILSGAQFWDGRADSLEAQAIGPIANPIEMGFTHEGVVQRLREIPAYRRQFEQVFGELTIERIGQAIAAFERVLVTAPSPYDVDEEWRRLQSLDADDLAEDAELAKRHAAAKVAAAARPLSAAARRGRAIVFGAQGHSSAGPVGAHLAAARFHNIGIGMDRPEPDPGRFAVSKDPKDTGAFKTPTVRNVAFTAPYMHDGSLATLEEVVEWYDKGGHANPHLSEKIKPLHLTPEEKADLVAFMQSCSGPTPTVETGRLPE